jgi:hypothetical protein
MVFPCVRESSSVATGEQMLGDQHADPAGDVLPEVVGQ